MAKSISLEFLLIDDQNRSFMVSFESESRERNLLMEVLHNGLPLDTVEIREYDIQLYKNIKAMMQITSENHWNEIEKEELVHA